jgi:hypothetical protein
MQREILGCRRSEVTAKFHNEELSGFIKHKVNQTKHEGMGVACSADGRTINMFCMLVRKL